MTEDQRDNKINRGSISDGFHTFDELYEHRIALFVALMRCNLDISWKSRLHADGSSLPDWFIAGIHLSSGDITYHLPAYKWKGLVDIIPLARAPHYDGHTPTDVVDRLESAIFTET